VPLCVELRPVARIGHHGIHGLSQLHFGVRQQLYYDRSETWEKEIPYYKYFKPAVIVTARCCYYLPAAWREPVELLRLNGLKMQPLARDTLMEVEAYYLEEYQTRNEPYNGHYWHYGTTVRKDRGPRFFREPVYAAPVYLRAFPLGGTNLHALPGIQVGGLIMDRCWSGIPREIPGFLS